MKVRTLLAAGVVGIGSLAVTNRLLRARADDPGPPLDGEQRTERWRGIEVAYTEAGDPADPDLVCLHGIGAAGSSHEFRGIVEELATDYHVIAPDLPGFGRSDRPPLRYSAEFYQDFVREFLEEYDTPTVLASGLTAAYVVAGCVDQTDSAGQASNAGQASTSHEKHSDDEIIEPEHLFLIAPTATAMPGSRPWVRDLLRAPVIGTGLVNGLVSKPVIRYFSRDHGYYDPARVTEDLVDYEWHLTHQPGTRYVLAAFLSGDLNADLDLGEALSAIDVPVTLIWGRESETTPLSTGRSLADQCGARLVVVDDSRLLPHAEHPEAFLEGVRDELGSV